MTRETEPRLRPEVVVYDANVLYPFQLHNLSESGFEKWANRMLRSRAHGSRKLVTRLVGLPPEKWSSVRYGFEPCGGLIDVEEAAQA